ncbi:hypothetical protein EIN_138190 [Entamoeba invadens IP1]|uniref:EGF-like domain-containing protein n=1 Tax=Entamoeba invadens IP1 TaxID=370355 RepID=L7FMM1_ENTIV|nr:hypothetical protein EIN_138190 [Entamoeba invadens IP1]ELP91802.1 hypothetical protein EIN_138190 [Entamoeba invadens IP1]|eukprot:XP_004258573.1 hypothetical protein EIN_138190 [Entamoeba invadens IP1]
MIFTAFSVTLNECPIPIENCLSCRTDNPYGCEICEGGYYVKDDKCSKCIDNCLTCRNATTCDACSNGYYESIGKCNKCTPGCTECSDANTCSECKTGLYLENNKCMREVYCDIFQKGCLKCKQDYTTCLSCISGYYLNNNSCIKCAPDCRECSDATTCTECDSSYYLEEGKCLIQVECSPYEIGCLECKQDQTSCLLCTYGYYLDNNSCTRCAPGCTECSGANTCSECRTGYYMENNLCLKEAECSAYEIGCLKCKQDQTSCLSCTPGYYLNGSTCTKCIPDCTKCKDAICYKCNTGYYLENNTCIIEAECSAFEIGCLKCKQDQTTCVSCTPGYHWDRGTCTKCTPGCTECNDAICSECKTGLYLENNKCMREVLCDIFQLGCLKCKQDYQTCLSCISGYYLDNYSCIKCAPDCRACSDATTCTDCYNGYYLEEGKCLEQVECSPYEIGCLECKQDQTTCLLCKYGYHWDNNSCTRCAPGCTECSGANTCTECRTGYYLNGKTCTKCDTNTNLKYINGNKCVDCATGKIKTDGTCDTPEYACGSGCATCIKFVESKTVKCIKCTATTDYINLDGTCSKTCKTGKADKDKMMCEKCTINGCETCQTVGNAEQCTNCGTKYISTNKLSCVDKCTTGKPVETPIKKCDACQTENCDVFDKDDKGTQCKTNFYLVADTSKCVDKCPEGYMTDETNNKCIKCTVEGCATCEKLNTCTACMAEYKLEGGKCNGANAVFAIMALVVMAFLF